MACRSNCAHSSRDAARHLLFRNSSSVSSGPCFHLRFDNILSHAAVPCSLRRNVRMQSSFCTAVAACLLLRLRRSRRSHYSPEPPSSVQFVPKLRSAHRRKPRLARRGRGCALCRRTIVQHCGRFQTKHTDSQVFRTACASHIRSQIVE